MHGLGPLHRAHADGTFDAYARDALGSVRAEVSATGSVTNAYSYASYGALRAGLGGSPLLGFAGELTDPSGLIYLRTRWYDAVIGRFLKRDAFAGNVRVPSTFNGFAYASGNPIVLIDPLGLDPQRSNLAYAIAEVFADLDSIDPFRRTTAYITVVAGGFAISGLGTALAAPLIESGLSAFVVWNTARLAAGSAYVIGETQGLVTRAAQTIGAVSMPYVANPALREEVTRRVINAVMDKGALIVNVGTDPTRLERGKYYLMELQEILQRNYTYVIDLVPK